MDGAHIVLTSEDVSSTTARMMRRTTRRCVPAESGSDANSDIAPLQQLKQQQPQAGMEKGVVSGGGGGGSDCRPLAKDVAHGATLRRLHERLTHCVPEEGEDPRIEAKCAALETERRWRPCAQAKGGELLGGQSMGDHHGVASDLSAMPLTEFSPFDPLREFVETSIDEFDDFTMDAKHAVRYDVHSAKKRYMYAEPRVAGSVFPVFSNGLLYRIVTPEGDWFFFNDTCQYVMHVKFTFDTSSVLLPGPNATLTRASSGTYEAYLRVMPGETEALVSGKINRFKCISTAELLREDFDSIHLERQTAVIMAQLEEISRAAGKETTNMTEAEALQACQCMQGSPGFIDPVFSPCHQSLFRVATDTKFLCALPWRRPQEFLPSRSRDECRLFCGMVRPQDPQMGSGCDAYLVSAMIVLAEFPMKVRGLFRHPYSVAEGKKERRQHAYRVTVGYCGWWTTVLVDDYFPASHYGPEFARCEDDLRKLWVPLLQKAYAKLYGSYAAIQYGDSLETLQDFIGFPTSRFDEDWARAREKGPLSPMGLSMFLMIESRHHMGYIVCLNAPDEGPPDAVLRQMGLCFGMSYYVMEVVRYGWYRLLKLRCTTPVPERKGMWANHCDVWKKHHDLAHICKINADTGSDGSFWLDWSEALDVFDGGGVCFTRFTYHDYRIRGAFEDCTPTVALVIEVTAPMDAYCLLSQEDDRGKPPTDSNASLVPIMLCVTRAGLEGRDLQCFDTCASTDPDAPALEECFIVARDVALHYRFEPSHSPFCIIPLMHGKEGLLPYTIGFLPSSFIGNASRVHFVHINCKFSENLQPFSAADLVPVETDYQIYQPSGMVETKRGSVIRDGRAGEG